MKNSKLIAFILGVLFIALLGYALGTGIFKEMFTSVPQTKNLQVVTTLFPLYDFAKVIGQDKVEVTLLLPPGVEAHSFEPKPNDVIRINQAGVFIYIGNLMEPWVEDVIKGVTNYNLLVVNDSDGIGLIPAVFYDDDELVEAKDPHIWLDFGNAKIMVNTIAKAFAEKDPENKSFYEQNTRDYKQKLADLDIKYQSALSTCKTKEIIYGGHYAFGYLANRYGLKYSAAQGVSPDAEPTAKDLIALVNQIRAGNVKYIFYEELASPKIAKTLSDETNAKLLLLNAGHNVSKEQLEQGVSYLSIMENNLTNLRVGLECQ